MSAQQNPGLKAQLESILFAAGKAVSIQDLQKLCKEKPEKIKAALEELSKDYNEHDSSLMLVEEGENYKLTVREQYLPLVKDVVSETELPKSIMETLAVIAFKHPILQSELVKIRSNKAYDHLNELEQTGYIKREAYGRTKKIHLTQKFFDYFDLPPNKVKEAFASFEAVSKEIEKQEDILEDQMQKIQEQRAEEKKAAKVGNLEVYEAEPEEEQEEKPLEVQVYDTNTEPMGNVEIIRGEDAVKQPELPLDSATHEVIDGEPDEDLDDEDTDSDEGSEDTEEPEIDEDSADSDIKQKSSDGLGDDYADSADSGDTDPDEGFGEEKDSDDEDTDETKLDESEDIKGDADLDDEDTDAEDKTEDDSDKGKSDKKEDLEEVSSLSEDLEEDLENNSLVSENKEAEGDELLEKRIKEKEEALLGKKSEDKPNKRDEAFDSISQDIEEQKDVLGK
ncbi:MAG: SMC-Scp complex subunit ScpB [Candidatus Woesearchaeota archaeon]